MTKTKPILASLFCVLAMFGVMVQGRSDEVEKPGQLSTDVTKLGGPCMAIKRHSFTKYGQHRIGDCTVRYTNDDQTTATVTLKIKRGESWFIITADAKTENGPLSSLNWHVISSAQTPLPATEEMKREQQ